MFLSGGGKGIPMCVDATATLMSSHKIKSLQALECGLKFFSPLRPKLRKAYDKTVVG
jgi:hypothetical protein